eukprot:1146814-Pelagomonas_calceolata.AAC.8
MLTCPPSSSPPTACGISKNCENPCPQKLHQFLMWHNAANKGLGFECARQLAGEAGFTTIVTARNGKLINARFFHPYFTGPATENKAATVAVKLMC